MNSPITMSCICGNLEKQILFLAKRLIRVRSVRCFLSIFWVFRLSTSCCSGIRWRWYEPQLSVKNFFIPKGSRSFLSSRNTLSVCSPNVYAKIFPLIWSIAAQPSLITFIPHKTPHLVHFWLFYSFNPDFCIIRFKTLNKSNIYFFDCRFFFFNSEITVDGLIFNTRAVSLIPLPFNAISTICAFTLGWLPLYE